jgi:hypothetical protein
MKVWFVSHLKDYNEDEPYDYDNMIDSGLYATEGLADREAYRLYEEDLKNESERYARNCERFKARTEAVRLLTEAGIDSRLVFFSGAGEPPEFITPKKRKVHFLWVDV